MYPAAMKELTIHYKEGFNAIKTLSLAVDEAARTGAPVKIKLQLAHKSIAPGFNEFIITSKTLNEAVALLKPVLQEMPHIQVEVLP